MKLRHVEKEHTNNIALQSLIWIIDTKFQDITSRTDLIILPKVWRLLSNLCEGMNEML